MIVAKNMLIPEVKVAFTVESDGLSWREIGRVLDRLDTGVDCYVVESLVRNGKDDWAYKYSKVA